MRAVAEDIGVDAVKIGMLGSVETIEAVREALDAPVGGAPVVLDPVMVAESGAHLLEPGARQALVGPAAAGHRRDAEPRRGARRWSRRPASRWRPRTPTRRRSRGRCMRSGRRRRGDGRARRRRRQVVDLFFDGERRGADRGPAPARRGGARLGLHALLGAGGAARARADAAGGGAGGARIASEAVRDGLREHRGGPGPVDVLGHALVSAPARAHDIIRAMRFLRLMPGKGEVVLAEGDPELSEDEQRLIEEFRRQLDSGMWAAVPITEGRHGPARGDDGAGLRRQSRGTPSE